MSCGALIVQSSDLGALAYLACSSYMTISHHPSQLLADDHQRMLDTTGWNCALRLISQDVPAMIKCYGLCCLLQKELPGRISQHFKY